MANYSIRFSVVECVFGDINHRDYEIQIGSTNDDDAKNKFNDWCEKYPTMYNWCPYHKRPHLVRTEVLSES